MPRAVPWILGGLTGFFALVVGFWLALPWILETWGGRWIAGSLNIPPPRFTVADLSPSRLELRDISIGDAEGTVGARALVLTFDAGRGRIESLTVEGARLEAVWRDGDLFIDGIGQLGDLLGGEDEDAPPTTDTPLSLPVEHLRVSGAQVLLRSPPFGLAEIVIDATATRRDGGMVADGAASAVAPGMAAEAAFTLTGGDAPGAPWLGLTGSGTLDVTARGATIPGVGEEVDGYASVALSAQPEGLRLTIEEIAAFHARAFNPALLAGLPEALAAEASTGGTIVASGLGNAPLTILVAPEGSALRMEGAGSLSMRLGGATARIDADGAATLGAAGLDALALDHLEVVANGVPALGGRLHGSLRGREVSGAAGALTLHSELYLLGESLTLQDVAVPRLRLTWAGPLSWRDGLARLGLTAAKVDLSGPVHLGGATLPKGLDWTLRPTEGDALMLDLGAEAPVLMADIAASDPALAVRSGGRTIDTRFAEASVAATLPLAGESPPAMTLTLAGGRVQSRDIALDAVAATLRSGPEGMTLEADARIPLLPGEVAPLPEAVQALRPLRLRLDASQGAKPDETQANGVPVRFTADLRDGGQRPLLTATGRHSLDSGRGQATVRMPRMTFGRDLQPAALYAPLADAALRVEGGLAAQGVVTWTDSTVSPRLEVLLDGVTAQRGFIVLKGMNGVVTLTQVWPPRTEGEQVVAVAAIDAGIPFSDASMTYRLDGKGNALIDQAEMTLADGTIHSEPFTLPLDGTGASTVLHMTGVSLDQLVEFADLSGLTATGTLSGAVPVELRDGNVLFHDGMLSAQEPGVIRYRPDEAPGALAAGGGGVDLMLQALDDFHYKSLRLSIAGSAAGDLQVGLHLGGANPALYGGYPLEFNLTLSGALAQVIEGSLSGYQVPDRIRRRMERFGIEP